MIRILFQGDSITDGGRLRDPNRRHVIDHQIGHSYVFSIAGTLGRRFPGKYCIINRGISGDSVEKITERWQTDTLDENPDILSILLGINGNGFFDGEFPEGVDVNLNSFEKSYKNLLSVSRKHNPNLKIVIIEPFYLPNIQKDEEKFKKFLPIFLQKQELVQQIAKEFDAYFVPVQKKLEQLVQETAAIFPENRCIMDTYAYWLFDGVHPTSMGHELIARAWMEGFEKL